MNLLIKNALVVNEGKQFVADVLIKNKRIEKIASQINTTEKVVEINAEGKWLLPGVIDDQVHFREPGLTHKAEIQTESSAAVAGGTTTFMEMPNTRPAALTQELLEEKYARAAQVSPANYSFFMGVSNDNAEEVLKTNAKKNDVCGIKIFMGSSTGNMLVDSLDTLTKIFSTSELLIATHCESEGVIKTNKEKYPNANDASFHPLIRNAEACYASSSFAADLAKRYNTRLHILHITTAQELALFTNTIPLKDKRLTNEVCVHHLHFTADDYTRLGTLIQCNPAIKAAENKAALWQALLDDRLDIIATDHAPHTWEEKQEPYGKAPSGLPLVQHSLQMMLDYVKAGKITLEKVVEKMSHAPAICFQIKERGFIREGYYADLVLVDPNKSYMVNKENLLYKCAWSPLEGVTFSSSISHTIVNGNVVFENGKVNDTIKGERIHFDRE